ncbi:glycosyltransferase [Kaistella flava (ex Peng et al. 2021)]|uniref:Glycosyltransferase n=1 Tax=Kaistella flava (ex Peng et al. 2021) TaxID=2038776 RepID=A0A7M2Y9R6_9FLAO|nr:glycosyltransferase [Kaistella flava (ex Peng et al. 2021)]QOW10891.1 glycosyltransferase [Kaistella flava (ex Peng et al. 2021)]
MLFSILIANYNNWKYFQECYQSILNQSFQNFEIVIVDDCSTDNSYKQLELLSHKDSKIKLFRNLKNEGVGYTKAKCVENANGEILGFLDPDDSIFENAIERSLEEYSKDNSVSATYSQIILCDDYMKPLNVYSRTRKIKNNNNFFFNINNEVSHFFTFKKSIYQNTVGINKTLALSEDFDMYLKIYEKGKLQYIEEPLYLYRLHSKGISQDKSKKKKLTENWNKVLYETCLRREITQIGNYKITQESNLSKIIFESENNLISKVKRYLKIN